MARWTAMRPGDSGLSWMVMRLLSPCAALETCTAICSAPGGIGGVGRGIDGAASARVAASAGAAAADIAIGDWVELPGVIDVVSLRWVEASRTWPAVEECVATSCGALAAIAGLTLAPCGSARASAASASAPLAALALADAGAELVAWVLAVTAPCISVATAFAWPPALAVAA